MRNDPLSITQCVYTESQVEQGLPVAWNERSLIVQSTAATPQCIMHCWWHQQVCLQTIVARAIRSPRPESLSAFWTSNWHMSRITSKPPSSKLMLSCSSMLCYKCCYTSLVAHLLHMQQYKSGPKWDTFCTAYRMPADVHVHMGTLLRSAASNHSLWMCYLVWRVPCTMVRYPL